MNTIGEQECKKWFECKGINSPEYSGLFKIDTFSEYGSMRCQLPKDSGKKSALAHFIITIIHKESNLLISLRNWDVWPSSGHKPLMVRLRQSLGCIDSLESKPCHIFNVSEADDATSLLFLGISFFWDCIVANEELDVISIFSHDGWYVILTKDKSRLDFFKKLLK